MDFKRIEWIFFLVFLLLNIFLFTIYQAGINEENSVSLSEQTESIEKRLAKDKISYEGKLSDKKSEGYYLSAEQTSFTQLVKASPENYLSKVSESDENTLVVYPKTKNLATNYFIDEKNIQQSLEVFLNGENTVIYGGEYEYLEPFSNMDAGFPEVVAYQHYKSISIKDDTAQVTITLDREETTGLYQISKYKQTHIYNIEELRDKMDLYSEKDAIETLYMNNRITGNTTIAFRKLAYTRIYKIREKNVYVPVWFVGIHSNENNLQIEQVNAMNNTIITTNTVPKVEDHMSND